MEHPISNSSQIDSLPSYKKPPVNEVVCGMRFHTPDNLRMPHIGLLWEKFRQDYPIIQHALPLASSKGELQIDIATGFPLPRVWFINELDNQLIQFQIDRFYFNWRCRNDVYPRYSKIIDNFEKIYRTIEDFFSEQGFGELKPIECELSYINHIPKGQGWNSIEDLSKIFFDFIWAQKRDRFLPNPSNIAWQSDFVLPENKGRLFINLKQSIRTDDKVYLFILELVARGLGESTSKEEIRKWFDMAHEWIVRGFTDLTKHEIQNSMWEREDA